MLNEAPKKPKKAKDYAHPNRWQLFWRIQRECWRRMVTPYLMYFFMSLIMLAFQAIPNLFAKVGIGLLCIGIGAFYNGHLCYHYGIMHYGAYVAGELHRKNELFGIRSGGDHRPEREYSPWKGFYIGFLIGIPVIVLGCLTGRFLDPIQATNGGAIAGAALVMFAGWAIIPISWLREIPGLSGASFYWSLLMVLLPILVSGVFYIVGAMSDKRKREEGVARGRRLEEAREEAAKQVRIQTEEQRRKTLQSKKKK